MPTIKTTTGDMLPKNAVLDDAMSVEIVVGNEGILRKIKGEIFPVWLHFFGKS